jgi:hypothetical protein
MRTQVIPAQITTVEDKIAGNLNFTQILLLITPVLLSTAVYALFPPSMSFVVYKLVIIAILSLICLILAVRIQGKVLVNWLGVVLKYALRPKYYVFNKNDTFQRELYLPEVVKKVSGQALKQKTAKTTTMSLGIPDLVKLEQSLVKGNLGMTFKTAKKGGLNVIFNKVAKES